MNSVPFKFVYGLLLDIIAKMFFFNPSEVLNSICWQVSKDTFIVGWLNDLIVFSNFNGKWEKMCSLGCTDMIEDDDINEYLELTKAVRGKEYINTIRWIRQIYNLSLLDARIAVDNASVDKVVVKDIEHGEETLFELNHIHGLSPTSRIVVLTKIARYRAYKMEKMVEKYVYEDTARRSLERSDEIARLEGQARKKDYSIECMMKSRETAYRKVELMQQVITGKIKVSAPCKKCLHSPMCCDAYTEKAEKKCIGFVSMAELPEVPRLGSAFKESEVE